MIRLLLLRLLNSEVFTHSLGPRDLAPKIGGWLAPKELIFKMLNSRLSINSGGQQRQNLHPTCSRLHDPNQKNFTLLQVASDRFWLPPVARVASTPLHPPHCGFTNSLKTIAITCTWKVNSSAEYLYLPPFIYGHSTHLSLRPTSQSPVYSPDFAKFATNCISTTR